MTLSDQLREGAAILRNRIDERVPIHRIAEDDICIANTEAILRAMRRAADKFDRLAKLVARDFGPPGV